jgi:hypothetical protein
MGTSLPSGEYFQTIKESNSALHLTFLFASPRYLRLDEFNYKESYDKITYDQEFSLLHKVMTQKNAALSYRRTNATVQNLIASL